MIKVRLLCCFQYNNIQNILNQYQLWFLCRTCWTLVINMSDKSNFLDKLETEFRVIK
jgi:hypothetical protein